MASSISPKQKSSGHTLPELTIVFAVIFILITVLLYSTQAYVNAANRAACLVNQDAIAKAIISQANLSEQTLVPGIDYFLDADYQEAVGDIPDCPAVGSYSAILDPNTGELVITCLEHGHSRE